MQPQDLGDGKRGEIWRKVRALLHDRAHSEGCQIESDEHSSRVVVVKDGRECVVRREQGSTEVSVEDASVEMGRILMDEGRLKHEAARAIADFVFTTIRGHQRVTAG